MGKRFGKGEGGGEEIKRECGQGQRKAQVPIREN